MTATTRLLSVAHRILATVLSATICVGTATTAFGQSAVQASIIGVVTDESGAVLPGVTVTASSPALQLGQVSTVTDADGQYRLTGLDLGTYAVQYGLEGFQGVRRDEVRLTAGFTAKLDVLMKLGSLTETITVSGASPVVDVTRPAAVTTITSEMLELIPTSRNGVQAMLAQVPGVRSNLDVGGNTAGAIPVFRAFGQSGGLWPVVEGLAAAYYGSGQGSGVYIDYGGVDEVSVSATGNDAETPLRGVAMTVIVKSGGNRYHGSLMGSYTNADLISNNVSGVLAQQGIRGVPIARRFDGGGDIGGFVAKDKLWFYLGIRGRVNDNYVLDCRKPDGSDCETLLDQKFTDTKWTYQMNKSHRLLGYYAYNFKGNTTGASQLRDWSSRFRQDFSGDAWKVEWQGTLRPNLVANALVGKWSFNTNYFSFDDELGLAPATRDLVTLRETGPSPTGQFTPRLGYGDRKQIIAGVSWYKGAGSFGDHNLKVGMSHYFGTATDDYVPRPAGDYVLIFSNGAPTQIQVYNNPVSSRYNAHNTGVYVKDQWRLSSRLTLSLGVRTAFDLHYVPAQSKEAGTFAQVYPAATQQRIDPKWWNTAVPRVNFAWDITNDARTVLKGGFGQFAPMRNILEAAYLSPLGLNFTTFRWRDLNGNRNFDFGETNLAPGSTDFISGSVANPGTSIANSPKTDEFNLSLERQLFTNFAVRVSGVVTRDRNQVQVINPAIPPSAYTIPVTNRDPGPDGVLNTADDTGQSFTYFEFPTSLRGAQFQQVLQVNEPLMNTLYRSVELALSKRLADKWQLQSSYTYTRLRVPPGTANPNLTLAAGGTNNTSEWNFKSSGSYQAPLGVLASINYEFRSGERWARTVLFRGGVTVPQFVARVESLGAQTYDNVHLLDARARKDFTIHGSHRIAVGVDVFNLLNINTVSSVIDRSGATFGRVSTAISGNTATLPFIPGRNVQFTLNYNF